MEHAHLYYTMVFPASDVFCGSIAGVRKPVRFGPLFEGDRPQKDRLPPQSGARSVLTTVSVRTWVFSSNVNKHHVYVKSRSHKFRAVVKFGQRNSTRWDDHPIPRTTDQRDVLSSETSQFVGKKSDETAQAERRSNTLRQQLARFVCKMLSFSQSGTHCEFTLKPPFQDHNPLSQTTLLHNWPPPRRSGGSHCVIRRDLQQGPLRDSSQLDIIGNNSLRVELPGLQGNCAQSACF